MDPLVDAIRDPVTPKYMAASHQAILDAVFCRSTDAIDGPVLEELLETSAWFRLELCSLRGICVDRLHVAPSFAVPLWDIEKFANTRTHERADINRNTPAVLLRRILRTEIAKEEIPRIVNALDEICLRQENYRDDHALLAPAWSNRPDNVSCDAFWHVIDLHYTLAPFTETAAFLFPLLSDADKVALAVQSLWAVLGRTEYVFDAFRIPPPSDECLDLLHRIGADREGTTWYPALCAHFQFYTTMLWRLVKAHRLKSALEMMMTQASRSVLEPEYNYDHLRLIEYRVQLFIDTHVSLYAYACGDVCWRDTEWMLGPSGRDAVDADVTAASPIIRFYPDCRNVLPCESEMPNASSSIELGNLRYDVNVKPAQPTQRQAFIHLFACKVLPHRCLVRNFGKILLRYVEGCNTKAKKPDFLGYPSIKEYVQLLIVCGLLGNWKMCEVRANFSKRIELIYAFMPILVPLATGERLSLDEIEALGRLDEVDDVIGSHPSRMIAHGDWKFHDSLHHWILNNDDLCFYVFKEAYVHMIEKRSTLDIVMNRNLRWGRYKNVVKSCLDRVRDVMNKDGGVEAPGSACMDWVFPLHATPERVQRQVALFAQMTTKVMEFHKLTKNCFIKLRKGTFVRVSLKQMNTALSRIKDGVLSETVLNALRDKDMAFFQVALDDDDDDEDVGDNEDDDNPTAAAGSGTSRADTSGNGGEDAAVDEGIGGDDEDDADEESGLRQERNLVAIAKFVRDLSQMPELQDIDTDLLDMVARDVMRRQQSRWRVELHWLVELFGVRLQNLRILQRVYSSYEAYDMPDHPIIKRMAMIYVDSPRDFHVIRLYLGMLLWHSGQLFLPLARDMRWRQILALRRRWSMPTHQHLPQDIAWSFFSPGNRHFYNSEPTRRAVKVDPKVDQWQVSRDLLQMTDEDEAVRVENVAAELERCEHMAELACSINMNRVTFDGRTGLLYAKTKPEPGLRRLRADAVHPEQVFFDPEQDLIALMEEEQEREDAEHAASEASSSNGDLEPTDGAETAASHEGTGSALLYANEYFSIRVAEDDTRRQFGVLTDEARAEYRERVGAPYLHDSSCSDPLYPIDLVGTVKSMNDRLYTLCVICGCVTQFTSSSLETIGPCCDSHDLDAYFKRNQKFLNRCERLVLPTEAFRRAADIMDQMDVVTRPSSNDNTKVRPTRSVVDEIHCVFCRTLSPLASPNSIHKRFKFLVTDTETHQVRQEILSVCNVDYGRVSRIIDPAMLEEDRPVNFHIRAPSTYVHLGAAMKIVTARRLKYISRATRRTRRLLIHQ